MSHGHDHSPTELRILESDEFHETMVPPMKRLTVDDEPPVKLDLRPSVDAAFAHYGIPKRIEEVEIPHVYVSGDGAFTHVLLNYGVRNVFVVIVIDNEARTILGAFQLDLEAARADLQ